MTTDQTSDHEPSFAPGDPASLNLVAGIVQDGTPDFTPLSVRYGIAEKILAALDLPARENFWAHEAWKEGRRAGWSDYSSTPPPITATTNPYLIPKENPDAR